MKFKGTIKDGLGNVASGVFEPLPEAMKTALNINHTDVLAWVQDADGKAITGVGIVVGGGAVFQLDVVAE